MSRPLQPQVEHAVTADGRVAETSSEDYGHARTLGVDHDWFKRAVFYEVLVRAFADSNRDGTGDLRGLTEKLDYIQWLGVDCIWLPPFYDSPLRDGGYDIADFAQLYLPPLMDPVYGFQAVNVEAEQRNPSSFLHWLRRLLQVRKEHPVFGTGSFEVLHADNPSVLAYLRSDDGNTVLCVHNLSRFPQPCELMLEQHAGKVPVELTGRVPFPAIGELPYFVTLAPHGFYWFRLQADVPEDPL